MKNNNKMIEDELSKLIEKGGTLVDRLLDMDFETLPVAPVTTFSNYILDERTSLRLNVSILPTTREARQLSVFAFDTGNRLGYAWIHNGVAVWGYTILVKDYEENVYPNVVAFNFAYNFISSFSKLTSAIPIILVEGSAIAKKPSQEFMAQIRSALFLGSYMYVADAYNLPEHRRTYQVSPQTVRKLVLGSGRIDPNQLYPEYNSNAIDALTIAWYGILKNSESV